MALPIHSVEVLLDASHYVKDYFNLRLPATRYFHGLLHTKAVLEECEAMASFYDIQGPDAEALFLAAWFHDSGYCHSSERHEEKSVMIANAFLEKYSVSEEFISLVNSLIRATKMEYQPATLFEKIIRDADTHHVGSNQYTTWSTLLKKELELSDGIKFTYVEWLKKNISFFKTHQFYTTYAIDNWEEQKQNNLQELLNRLG